jgi:hypothetical protein
MRGGFPLEVELIDLFWVFGGDELGDILELFSELEDGFFENCYFSWRPILEHVGVGDGVDENI